MSNIKNFPSTEFYVIHSVNKRVSFEKAQIRSCQYSFTKNHKAPDRSFEKKRKELISVKSMNHVLWVKLRAERKRLKEDSSHAKGCTRADVND